MQGELDGGSACSSVQCAEDFSGVHVKVGLFAEDAGVASDGERVALDVRFVGEGEPVLGFVFVSKGIDMWNEREFARSLKLGIVVFIVLRQFEAGIAAAYTVGLFSG